jgi:sugar-phosphatase
VGPRRGAALHPEPPERGLAFEDAPAGVEAAVASGATTVVVGTLEAPVTAGLPRITGYDGIEVVREGSAFRIRG